MYYILFRSRGCFLTEIVSPFLSNVVLNDKAVERFVDDLLKSTKLQMNERAFY